MLMITCWCDHLWWFKG